MRLDRFPVGLTLIAFASGAWGAVETPPADTMAYHLGQNYAFSSVYSLLKKSEASANSMQKARTLASALGIAEPTPPGNAYAAHVAAMAKQLGTKHGKRVQSHFLVGLRQVDAWFGAKLGADVTTQVSDLAAFLASSGIPDDVWGSLMTKIKAQPTAADLEALGRALAAHLSPRLDR